MLNEVVERAVAAISQPALTPDRWSPTAAARCACRSGLLSLIEAGQAIEAEEHWRAHGRGRWIRGKVGQHRHRPDAPPMSGATRRRGRVALVSRRGRADRGAIVERLSRPGARVIAGDVRRRRSFAREHLQRVLVASP